MEKHTKTGLSLAFFLAVVGGLLVAAAGGAVAADVEIANDTVEVDNDTASVYAEIDATNNTGDANVTVEFVPIADGNESDPITRNLTVASGETTLEEYKEVNNSEYDSYRVVVTADNSTNTTATVGTFQKVAGGSGGGGIGGTGIGAGAAAALVVVALLVFRGGED